MGLNYDPMLAKLVVHATTRDEAIDRMRRALLELTVDGVETSRDFHLRVMEDAEFRAGAIDIQWLERRLTTLIGAAAPPETARLAALVAAMIADRDRVSARRAPSTTLERQPSLADGWTRTARVEALR